MISIVVPIYNKEKYLKKCIDSIINQTYKNIEIILVNDGSTDKSLKICEEYKRDSRVKIINKNNGGVSSARNVGIEKSKGEKILFVDADDYIKKDYVENLFSYNDDLVISSFYTQKGNKFIEEKKYNDYFKTNKEIQNNILNKKYIKFIVTPYLKLFKRNIIEQNRIRFEENMNFGEDVCFVFDYVKYCETIRFIPYCGYYNSIIDGTLSRKYIVNLDNQTKILEKKIQYFLTAKNKEIVDYWKYRNVKLILYNERKSTMKTFITNIKKIDITDINEKNKEFNLYDKIIFKLLKRKKYLLIYIIYHIFR